MVQLTHIGEQVIAEMFKRSKDVQSAVLSNEVLKEHISLPSQAMPELPLESYGHYIFDGAHRIDVAVLFPESRKCLAIEAKLGIDRLAANAFRERFLNQCGISHGGARITGSMVAILEGKVPPICTGEPVFVKYEGESYRLLNSWVLIVRQRILDGWSRNCRPDFTDRCILLKKAAAYFAKESLACTR